MGFIYHPSQHLHPGKYSPVDGAAHLPLATSEGDVDESSGVLESLKSSALGDLGLLLLLDLYTGEWSVIAIVGIREHRGVEPWGSET